MKKTKEENMKKNTPKNVLLVVVLLFVLALALFPILYPLMSSFRTDKEIYEYSMPFQLHTLWPVNWTFENYKMLFTEYNFGQYLLNTLFEIGVIIPLTILICSLAAFDFTTSVERKSCSPSLWSPL